MGAYSCFHIAFEVGFATFFVLPFSKMSLP